MAERQQLERPWLVAVWPGMGGVAINAGYYLLSKLDMHVIAELDTHEFFDIEHVEVKDGIIQPARRPRNRLFAWTDPNGKHDLVVFLGEAQPVVGKYPFCQKLIGYASALGVERVYTFAAMATGMHPTHRSRVFGAATDADGAEQLRRLDLELLEEGHIGGLNGVLLGAAAEAGLPGACLLGEMPHLFSQLPFPKASLAVLEVFTAMVGMEIDLGELGEQARAVEERLGELLSRVEQPDERPTPTGDEESSPEPAEKDPIGPADRGRIERLFEQASQDRSKAFELKQLLDRLRLFKEYEDRFLDLFRKPT